MTQDTHDIRKWIRGRSNRNASESDGETIAWLRPAAVSDVELLVAHRSARRWRVFHEQYVVCPCTKANADYRYRGKVHALNSGDYMLMEPGEMHVNLAVRQPADFTALFISPSAVSNAARELGIAVTPHFRLPLANNPAFFRALQEFQAALERGETALEQQSRFAVCLRSLLDRYTERAPPMHRPLAEHHALARAQSYLRQRFAEPICLDELAVVAKLSRFHLLRMFTRRYGLPPHAYQIALRIARARRLLQQDVSPAVAASDVGFADQSHFTRHFKRLMGVTPARYAQAVA